MFSIGFRGANEKRCGHSRQILRAYLRAYLCAYLRAYLRAYIWFTSVVKALHFFPLRYAVPSVNKGV